MGRLPKLYTHNATSFSSNCARGTHIQCKNYTNICSCKCHSDKKYTGSIIPLREKFNKKARDRYASMTQTQREDRNKRVRYMRKIGRWKSN